MARLIHFNGPPGIGKSTLARRYVAEHPGVLNCDIDVLRTMIGGWADDFAGAGALVRPAALALIRAYLAEGHDVVLPQMLARLSELERFEEAAAAVGAGFVSLLLMDDKPSVVARFNSRGTDGGVDVDPWHDHVRRIVAAEGGDDVITSYHRRLVELRELRPDLIEVRSIGDDVENTYGAVLRAVGGAP